ncbi:MAG: TolC family protein [Verrucomicrobia bacterium]|nr:TolC family protein [Verrucomicrobiota bacterium]
MNCLKLRLLCPLGAALLICGCVNTRNDVGQVSLELTRRSGYSVTNVRPGEVVWPAAVSPDDGLSEDEAVTLALWNNAAFQETLVDLGLSRADLLQAGMLPNPTLSMLIPVGTKPLEMTAKYPFEILWLRPKRIAAAKLDYERTAQRLVQGGLDLIRDVRLAFAEVTLADERLKLVSETLSLNSRIAELAQARLRAGDASELEAGQAKIDTLQTREQVTRARQDAGLARERLRHLVGLSLGQWTGTTTPSSPPPRLERPAELLLTNALTARPDLRAVEIGLEAAGKRIGLAHAEAFTLAAGINGKDVGSGASKEFLVGPTLDFAVPILNQNQGGVAQARAKFEKAARQYNTVRDRIALEVRESHARMAQAQESLDQWQQRILPPLEDAARQAEKAFSAGNVTYLFVLDNNRKLFDARAKAASAVADLRRARAELERSVGQRLDIEFSPSTLLRHETN